MAARASMRRAKGERPYASSYPCIAVPFWADLLFTYLSVLTILFEDMLRLRRHVIAGAQSLQKTHDILVHALQTAPFCISSSDFRNDYQLHAL
jgi:hypothetical protein